jgi:hypothetical protein
MWIGLELGSVKQPRNRALFACEYQDCVTSMSSEKQVQSDDIREDIGQECLRFRSPFSLDYEVVNTITTSHREVNAWLLAHTTVQRCEDRMFDFGADVTRKLVLEEITQWVSKRSFRKEIGPPAPVLEAQPRC